MIGNFLQFLLSADGSQFKANFLSSVFTRGLGLSVVLVLVLVFQLGLKPRQKLGQFVQL